MPAPISDSPVDRRVPDERPRRFTLSVVSPCYNEVEVIGLFYEQLAATLARLPNCDAEVIFVDDGSSDGTLEMLQEIAAGDARVRVGSLSRNFGHQLALSAGLDFADGDAVVMMDCDLQHPPALIETLVARWREGFDIVSAVREETEGVSAFKRLSSRAFYFMLNRLSDTYIQQGAADFCLVSRRVCRVLKSMRERHRFLRGMIAWAGFSRTFVPYTASPRAAGQSKYTLRKMVAMALDAVMSFSTAPIRLATRVGLIVTVLGFAYLVWNLASAYVLDAFVPGWASLIGVTMILGGSQLLFIGLIGQYLARVFEELKGRPLYIFKQEPRPTTGLAVGERAARQGDISTARKQDRRD